ncbi:MAG: transcriptional regulator [Burkholderiales bacterium]|nr:transcriptional regulator [Burkholderiales bacterium]
MSMETHRRCQLTIIAEYVLESRLVALVERLGAHGYTVHEVRGGSFSAEGERRREGAGETDRTIEMKVICGRATAEIIAREVLGEFGPHFSVRLLLSEVEVLRPAKY